MKQRNLVSLRKVLLNLCLIYFRCENIIEYLIFLYNFIFRRPYKVIRFLREPKSKITTRVEGWDKHRVKFLDLSKGDRRLFGYSIERNQSNIEPGHSILVVTPSQYVMFVRIGFVGVRHPLVVRVLFIHRSSSWTINTFRL